MSGGQSGLTFSEHLTDHPTPAERRGEILASPGFGKYFTDHMVRATWTPEERWHHGVVVPYGPISLDPAAAVLHYAQEIFEGLKAYRHPDGSVWTFRPEANAERLNRSARRLALPELPGEDFLGAIQALVRVDQAWVPSGAEQSLYLRPFMFASETFLGVRPAREVTFMAIACPVGAYFAGGVKPVSIWLSTSYTRAAPGGTGAAKCGGNYAASLAPMVEAAAHGCDQVAFLDAAEHRWVEELGGMNLYFAYRDGRLVTPELGTILEGVTRSSLLTLAKEHGLDVEERRISIEEWRDGVESGEISEVFACGTAAVITPVGRLLWEGGEVGTDNGEPGPVALKLRQALLDIQYGRARDLHGWMRRLV
ncbi:MAG TPA: branched-chain amino acid aminotransferase [Kineosporiaceae bacterium]|nr:branched-chain amino acid aminotransferase [Kineosporiaceae bacterium]